MANRKRPAEFPTDWHWEEHHAALVRELAGRQNRLAELKAMPGAEEGTIAEVESEITAVEAQLEHYGWGAKSASKRPAGAAKKTRNK